MYRCLVSVVLSSALSSPAMAELAESRELAPFSYIDVSGVADVTVVNGEVFKVEIIGEVSQVRAVSTVVEDGELVITARTTEGKERPVKVTVRAKTVQGIDASGTMNLKVQAIRGDFDLDVNGAVKAELDGQARHFNVSLAGASEVRAFSLLADRLEADLSGAALLEITVRDRLAVDASGASRVFYRGSPKKRITDVTGMAAVKSMNATTTVDDVPTNEIEARAASFPIKRKSTQ